MRRKGAEVEEERLITGLIDKCHGFIKIRIFAKAFGREPFIVSNHLYVKMLAWASDVGRAPIETTICREIIRGIAEVPFTDKPGVVAGRLQ